jgi:type II secretory pathway pseudopilin PulG
MKKRAFTPLHPENPAFQNGDEWQIKIKSSRKPRPVTKDFCNGTRPLGRGVTGFTLAEVLLIVVIAGILASIAIPSYQNFLEDQKAKVCETNLKTLKQALDIYAIDHDTMPASLSELPNEILNKALARVLQEKGAWRIKFACFIVGLHRDNLLYAAPVVPFVQQLARGNNKILVCPKDDNILNHGGISYGIYSSLAKMKKRDYKDDKKLSRDIPLLGDCDMPVFSDSSQLKDRHGYQKNILDSQKYALAITKNGKMRCSSNGVLSSLLASVSLVNIKNVLSSELKGQVEISAKADKDLRALVEKEGGAGASGGGGNTTAEGIEAGTTKVTERDYRGH